MSLQQHILLESETAGVHTFKWARCRKKGYNNPRDPWDLPLKQGQKVKLLKDMGRDWCIAENLDGQKGWVHMSILDVKEEVVVDPKKAYTSFHEETTKMLRAGDLCVFPDLSKYVPSCAQPACVEFKKHKDGLGICVHDLEKLFKGSATYGLAFLKTERTRWHPDKFPRICHPDHQEELMKKAGLLFSLCGILIDALQDRAG